MSEFKGDILKVRLGDDTRRMVLFNTNISYDDLVLMLQRVFDGCLRSNDEVTLKYIDEDEDLITIADAADFAHAREYSVKGVIKMIVFVNGRDIRTSLPSQQVKGLRKELYEVRDKVNALVDALADTPLITQAPPSDNKVPVVELPTVVTAATSMFDPLTKGSNDLAITTPAVSQLTTTTTDTVTPQTAPGPSALSLFSSQQNGGAPFLDQSQTAGRSSSPSQPLTQPTGPPQATSTHPSGYNYQQQPLPSDQTKTTGYTQTPYTGNQTYSSQPTAPPTAPPTSNYQVPPTSGGYPPSSAPSYPPGNAYQQPSSGNYPASYGGGANAYQPPTGYPQGQPPRPNTYTGYGAPRANPYKVGY